MDSYCSTAPCQHMHMLCPAQPAFDAMHGCGTADEAMVSKYDLGCMLPAKLHSCMPCVHYAGQGKVGKAQPQQEECWLSAEHMPAQVQLPRIVMDGGGQGSTRQCALCAEEGREGRIRLMQPGVRPWKRAWDVMLVPASARSRLSDTLSSSVAVMSG
jgi:hypothetical protein